MTAQPYHIYIERLDASRNMARYYVLQITMNLFGDICLTRSWGRIGKRGQTKEHVFEREADAIKLFLDILRQKRLKGYRPAIKAGLHAAAPCRQMLKRKPQSTHEASSTRAVVSAPCVA